MCKVGREFEMLRPSYFGVMHFPTYFSKCKLHGYYSLFSSVSKLNAVQVLLNVRIVLIKWPSWQAPSWCVQPVYYDSGNMHDMCIRVFKCAWLWILIALHTFNDVKTSQFIITSAYFDLSPFGQRGFNPRRTTSVNGHVGHVKKALLF